MALLSMLIKNEQFRTRFQDPADKEKFPDLFIVEATMSEVHTYNAETTENPIEDGSEVTDNVRVLPMEYQIDGMFSETPLGLNAQLAGLTTAAGVGLNSILGGFKGGIGQAAVAVGAGALGAKLFGNTQSPLVVAKDQLKALVLNKKLVRIVSRYETMDNMILYGLSFTRDSSTGRSLKFSVKAKQIKIVQGETVTLDKIARAVAHSAGAKQKLGKQSAADANAAQAGNGSLLFRAASGLGLIGGQ